jgi:ribonuclease J
MEGTMLGRGDKGYEDEDAVEARMTEIFRLKENIAFVFCSSQNIDRLVSVYRAVKRTQKMLVIDLYTACILDSLKVISDKLPQYWWEDIRVKYSKHHADVLANSELKKLLYKYRRAKIELEEINRDKKKVVMLVKDNSTFRVFLKHLGNLACWGSSDILDVGRLPRQKQLA